MFERIRGLKYMKIPIQTLNSLKTTKSKMLRNVCRDMKEDPSLLLYIPIGSRIIPSDLLQQFPDRIFMVHRDIYQMTSYCAYNRTYFTNKSWRYE